MHGAEELTAEMASLIIAALHVFLYNNAFSMGIYTLSSGARGSCLPVSAAVQSRYRNQASTVGVTLRGVRAEQGNGHSHARFLAPATLSMCSTAAKKAL